MINYRIAEERDLDEISKLSAQAYKNYCFYKETLGKEFNDEKKYEEFLCKLFYVWAKANLKNQLCIVAVHEEKLIACANLKRPYDNELGLFDYIIAGGLSLFKYLNPITILKFLELTDKSHNICNKLKPNAWYLESIVVTPDYQRKGFGSKIIDYCLKSYIINSGGTEVSLITNSENNCKFYTKQGFKIIDESIITFKNTKLKNWSFYMKLL